MCGIAGLVFFKELYPKSHVSLLLQKMLLNLKHRGPDDEGIFLSDDGKVALGHTRLSIRDLTKAGHQPMITRDGRFVLIYNGELYGYDHYRNQILDEEWSSKTDTEILLKLLSKTSNVNSLLNNLDGMFAFSFYDNKNKSLILARDQFGIKPLYYCLTDDFLIYASEPRAIFATGLVKPELSEELFLLLATLKMEGESEFTWFKNIKQLQPGSLMTVDPYKGVIKNQIYWLPKIQERMISYEEVFDVFTQAIIKRIPADVQRSMFLSGGVDSSAILSEMINQNIDLLPCIILYEGKDLKQNADFEYAKYMAEWKKIEYLISEIAITNNHDLLKETVQIVHRPIIHGAELAMLKTYELISKHQRIVNYSGHGADEMWGYQEGLFPILSTNFRPDMHSQYYLSNHLYQTAPPEWYKFLLDHFYDAFSIKPQTINEMIWDVMFEDYRRLDSICPHKKGRFHMMRHFMLNINNFVDHTSMHFSIEDRPIFQDLKLCQLAFDLPEHVKNQQGISDVKPFLKKSLASLLPEKILYRDKIGFQSPRDEVYRRACIEVLNYKQPFDLNISSSKFEQMPMNQILFLASTQLWLEHFNM